MSLNDPVSNVLSSIMNAERISRSVVQLPNNSKVIRKILEIMKAEQYVGDVDATESRVGDVLTLNLLGAINKVGVIKPRYQVKAKDFEKFEQRFLPAKDFGILIVSTNKGMMTHIEAKKNGVGGKLLAYCY